MSGQLDKAAGIPARKEWPDKKFASLPMCLASRSLRVAMNVSEVKNLPLSKVKTGPLYTRDLILLALRPFRALKGQQSGKGKMSTKSPRFERRDFGKRMFTTA
jgi:hypothetical protein